MTYDTLIMIMPSDFSRLEKNYKYLVDNMQSERLFFVGPLTVKKLTDNLGLGNRTGFICEDDILPFGEVHSVMKDHLQLYLKGQELPRGMTGWYYQQFLKMQYARICPDPYYMVWDGDTIPCRQVDMFDRGTGLPFFDMKKEYHKEYFDTINKLFPGMTKSVELSFISEHMIIDKDIMQNMLDEIEDNTAIRGEAFWEKIIRSIEPEHIKDTAFSEFETFGTYVTSRHPSAYRMRRWHSFRLGAEFFDPDTITERDYAWLGGDFDAISFEKNQAVRKDHRNLFDNPKYQAKLTARQMLEIAQEEFKEGFIEEWEDEDPVLAAIKNDPESDRVIPYSPIKYLPVDIYKAYEALGDGLLGRNRYQAFLCYEYASFLCRAAIAAIQTGATGESENIQGADFYTDCREDLTRIISKYEKLSGEGAAVSRVTFIILSYNNLYFTKRCLESIYSNCDPESYDIIVLDNASTDGADRWLKQQSSEDFMLLLSDENMGFAKGCNCAASYARKGNDIMLLNNDTRMTAGALFWLRMGLYSGDGIGAVGGMQNYGLAPQHVDAEFAMPEEYMQFGALHNMYEAYSVCDESSCTGRREDNFVTDPEPLAGYFEEGNKLSGFAMLVRRSIWDAMEGFDESFSPGYFEDDDLCERIKRAGYKMLISKKSFIYHAGSQSFASKSDVSGIFERNRKRFMDKWGYDSYE